MLVGFSIVVLTAFVFWEAYRQRYVSLLRDRANLVWIELGAPKGLLSRLLFNEGLAVEQHIYRRRYVSIGDGVITSAGARARFALLVFLVAVVLWGLVSIYSFATYLATRPT